MADTPKKSINDLKSNFSDFIRPNLYAVYIFTKDFVYNENIAILTAEATFPFCTFTTNTMNYNNRNVSMVNGIDLDPATFSFYVDRENILMNFFDTWKSKIMNENFQFGYYDDYVAKIEIDIFDRQYQRVSKATLIDAFPVNFNSFSLGYANNDTIQNLEVSFTYKQIEYEYFKVEKQAPKPPFVEDENFLTLGNLRRGVNLVSKMKNYVHQIKQGNPHDILSNARHVWSFKDKIS